MKILFFSDPHVGVKRQAHTTAASRARLSAAVLQHLENRVLWEATTDRVPMVVGDDTVMMGGERGFVVCGGDFFDTFSNPETVILGSQAAFQRVDICLAGNHDIANDAIQKGSLDLMSEWADSSGSWTGDGEGDPKGRVVRAAFGEKLFHVEQFPSTDLYLIPHHSSRALFEEALQEAYNHCVEEKGNVYSVLVLHCNYDKPEIGLTDTAQNLSREDAQVLLEVFDFVLLGHEHHPAEYYGGRLKLIGNTFPTSFGDISDKRVLRYDTDTGEMESITVWSQVQGYVEIEAEKLLEFDSIGMTPTIQFVDVTGNVEASQVAAINRAISDKLWRPWGEQLLAVRNSTGTLRDEKVVSPGDELDGVTSLPKRIDKALQGTKMYPLWDRVYSKRRETINE